MQDSSIQFTSSINEESTEEFDSTDQPESSMARPLAACHARGGGYAGWGRWLPAPGATRIWDSLRQHDRVGAALRGDKSRCRRRDRPSSSCCALRRR